MTVILGDWGTSRLRLFRMADGQAAERAEGPGIGAITDPAAALLAALAPWRGRGLIEVVLCGMAGARGGLVEAPYAECPAGPGDWFGQAARVDLDGVAVRVLPGLACTNEMGAPDVMRGEETQIFGAVALDPALGRGKRLVALPGTHSKWAVLDEGRVIGFRTWFTGELYALLSEQSTLLRAGAEDEAEVEGFDAGLARVARDPDLLGSLFTARAAQLRQGRGRGWARGFLSGLLIGHEVAAAADGAVTLIGGPALTAAYARALAARGIAANELDGDACALAGLQLHQSHSAKDPA